jgi:serine/threonine protein phosphatase PrpC
MPVVCPACGRTSQDAEFCDHCNAELSSPAFSPVPLTCWLSPQTPVALTPEQAAALTHPEAAVRLEAEGRRWRLHWVGEADWEAQRDTIYQRAALSCAALPPCRIIEQAAGAWVAAEVEGEPAVPWLEPAATGPLEPLRHLVRFLEPFAAALEALHAAGKVWLTFDPRHIEVIRAAANPKSAAAMRVRFTNLDLRSFPARANPERLQVCPGFAAPEVCRFQVDDLGPRTDVFHLAMYAYYWLAKLLPAGFPGKGLESFGFAVPPLRVFAPGLPPGVAAALARGLEVEPGRRYVSPTELVDAVNGALARAEQRWAATGPLTWEIAAHTRTGRCKEALGLQNEDNVLVRPFPAPERALLAVADGISICDVGSGGLASWLTCLVLDNSFSPASTAGGFPNDIAGACRRAADGLLAWAFESGRGHELRAGASLMGTTLTAAWLEGNALQVVNIGDSRAYLVEKDNVEQLTVDGDVACTLLAMGMPPEAVEGLGRTGKALHGCIGSIRVDDAGAPQVIVPDCHARLTIWPLLPGDVVVLCSDGLVDEGMALEPAEMAELVRRCDVLPAEELARQLADAADARQQLPTPVEPEGFGDNISCIVVKVAGPPSSDC